jgi:hypothetical protein
MNVFCKWLQVSVLSFFACFLVAPTTFSSRDDYRFVWRFGPFHGAFRLVSHGV